MEAWRSSCPRRTAGEDALAEGLIQTSAETSSMLLHSASTLEIMSGKCESDAPEEHRPMSDNENFTLLMTRLREGDEEAAAELFHRFAGRLAVLAGRRLGPRARVKVDPEDVVQSAFKSFFKRQAAGQFRLQGWEALWALLTTITLHKCGHKLAYLHGAKRDINREVAPAAPDLSDASWHFLANDPTPHQATVLTETVDHLLSQLDGCHRDIFRLALDGYSSPEIAEQLDVTERTVQRVLKRIREKLERMAADPTGHK
jgi:RNA polymerase sigma-70 factor, ECF subfamily